MHDVLIDANLTPEAREEYARNKTRELCEKFTPEINPAAYARISRSPKGVDGLIEDAWNDVPEARKSNEAIIFGMGHHSVADHALFNLNMTGVSRLLVEKIEERRLAGYTEKSQRYVTLAGDFVRPREYYPDDLKKFENLVKAQNSFYFKYNPLLHEHLKNKYSAKIESLEGKAKSDFLRDVNGWAKEDARYSLSLATITQLGCSYTGQTAEHAIRKTKYGRLEEEREFSKKLFEALVPYAPSLIQLADADVFKKHNNGRELQEDHFKYADENLRSVVEKIFLENKEKLNPGHYNQSAKIRQDGDVKLVQCRSISVNVYAALLFANSNESINDCYAMANLLQEEYKVEDLIKEALKFMSAHDKPQRAFEVNGGLVFGITLSSSAFAQLKRHRMMTLIPQDYDLSLGCTIPPNIEEIGAGNELRNVCDMSSEFHNELEPRYGKAAEYCLTNAHRRDVLVNTNLRNLYNFSRFRDDEHAQWDIRGKAHSMTKLAKQKIPFASMLLGGKDEYNDIYKKIYGEK
jgi:thymidylate synthase ThyX